MERLYFTFGSASHFPFGHEDYIIAIGKNREDCFDIFRSTYPNPNGTDVLNCADYYSAEEWEKNVSSYYKDTDPEKILVSDTVYGEKPDDHDPIWIFVPGKSAVVFIQPGSGCNLSREDVEKGFEDYVDFSSFELGHDDVSPDDGGMLMTKKPIEEQYTCLSDAIPDVLDILYDDPWLEAQVLKISV